MILLLAIEFQIVVDGIMEEGGFEKKSNHINPRDNLAIEVFCRIDWKKLGRQMIPRISPANSQKIKRDGCSKPANTMEKIAKDC